MPIFTIVYNNNSKKKFEAESKESLIRDFSLKDATTFQNDVKEIRWDEKDYCYIETISSGKISKRLNILDEK
jgi:hypothetical protein